MPQLILTAAVLAASPGPLEARLRTALATFSAKECAAFFHECESWSAAIPFVPKPADVELLRDNRLEWTAAGASLVEMARITLLLRAIELNGTAMPLVSDWYLAGDEEEKRAVARALWLVPQPKSLVDVGVLAATSQRVRVFEGICLDNPFPAAYFDMASFELMVARALDIDPNWAPRIMGLNDRASLVPSSKADAPPFPSTRALRAQRTLR
ncbi:MAG: EboA domain-containing protein [Polyangiaceae bacterium]|nr:EboA domain-containing protein [Polyangiaceae bacterium]